MENIINNLNNQELTFPEKLILLALNDQGWFGSAEYSIKFGLAGAIIFELYKRNRIELKEGVIVIKDPAPLDDPLLDKVFEFIKSGKRNKSLRTWIQKMVYKKMMIRKSILRALMAKQIIRKEEYSFLWVMYQFKYPVMNHAIKQQVQDEIFRSILNEEKPGGYELMMIALMDTCKIFRKNFRNFENYSKFRRKMKEVIPFVDPAMQDVKMVGALHLAMRRAIMASNVHIHA